MKKKILSILLVLSMLVALAACGTKEEAADNKSTPEPTKEAAATKAPEATATPAPTATTAPTPVPDVWEALTGGEMVDGKFTTTRKITVEIYDRGNDGGTDPTDNMYTDYIKKGMLEKHNVEVEFVAVPRWTETEQINNLLAANDAPDICYTYSYPTIQTYAGMGAVLDLGDLVEDYKEILPNMWNHLGDYNINHNRDPKTGELWAIEGLRAQTQRIVTFIRKDWVDKLGLQLPTTTDEFYNVIKAFKDNADTLLGADASKIVPFSCSYDIGWRAALVIESFIDPDITDKEYYINGFDDRKYGQNGVKEAVRLLNKWYNEGLMWNDFIVYSGSNDSTVEDDMMKAGYVGAFQHNWDYPYRNGEDSIEANLKRMVGEEATFYPIDCFTDKNGGYTKFGSDTASDRKIFFPATNDEPLASILYVDFISDPEVIQYLQIGDEGVTHEVLESGAIKTISRVGEPSVQNSGQNIDYTMTNNGLNLIDDELTTLSLAYNYANIDPALVVEADRIAKNDVKVPVYINVGAVTAEEGVGESLHAKRDEAYDNAMAAPVDEFDAVWDQYLDEYLSIGGQDIIDERAAKWEEFFGSAEYIK